MNNNNNNGRDQLGRFSSGNRVSVGKQNRRRTNEYLHELADAMTPERWKAIIERAITDACAGDSRARAWLTDYLIGEPIKMLDLPAADQQMLNEILSELAARNVSPSSLFQSMLQQLAGTGSASEIESDYEADAEIVDYE